MSAEREVAAAAAAIVAAFADSRTDDYFAAFTPEATFVFHTTARRLESVEEYREQWQAWESEDGFRVLGCVSSNQRVQLLAEGAAVFVHDVETRVRAGGVEETQRERETIVFTRREHRWLAIHEHLSPAVP